MNRTGLKVRAGPAVVRILHVSDTHSLHRSTGKLPEADAWRRRDLYQFLSSQKEIWLDLVWEVPKTFEKQQTRSAMYWFPNHLPFVFLNVLLV